MARIWLEYPADFNVSNEYQLREQVPYQDGYSIILEGDNGECIQIHAHDDNDFEDASITLETRDQDFELKLRDLIYALGVACQRKVVFREQSGHIMGFANGVGPHTLYEAAQGEDIPQGFGIEDGNVKHAGS